MLVIELVRRLRRLPLAMLLGLVLMAVAGVLDVVMHLGGSPTHDHSGFASEHLAHVVGIAGMVLVMAGVVVHGARRPKHRRRAATHGGLDSNAPR